MVDAPAVVLGLGLQHRAADVIDYTRCAAAGVEVVQRRAGGGAVLLDAHVLCCTVCVPLPNPCIPDDLTASYQWLGEHFVSRLHALGIPDARRVEVAAARADVSALRARQDPLLASCYGALSPHEVVAGQAKVVGLAQVRRRHAVLYQVGVLLEDQSRLADLLNLPDPATREAVRAGLRVRSVGLRQMGVSVDANELAERLG